MKGLIMYLSHPKKIPPLSLLLSLVIFWKEHFLETLKGQSVKMSAVITKLLTNIISSNSPYPNRQVSMTNLLHEVFPFNFFWHLEVTFLCALHPTPEGQNILILSRQG